MTHRIAALLLAFSAAAQAAPTARADQHALLLRLALRYRAHAATEDPTAAYAIGAPGVRNDRWPDRRPAAMRLTTRWKSAELAELRAIDPAALTIGERSTYANLTEQLEADLQRRICMVELWDVNHFDGWQASLAGVAAAQPVATPAERRAALARWWAFRRFVRVEIANLRRGLRLGYSAPRSVVGRVIAQLDAQLPTAGSPTELMSPAERSQDPVFRTAFERVIQRSVYPSIHAFRSYLAGPYMRRARSGIALSDLPNGRACYAAMLRANTTLPVTPEQVYDLGQRTVEANLATIRRIGAERFGTTDIGSIVAQVKADASNRFTSPSELLDFTRATVARARETTSALVAILPDQELTVEPERPSDEASGVSSHYDPSGKAGEPAVFRLQMGRWRTQTRGEAAITATHEGWPGHHLQFATARAANPDAPLGDLIVNSAYVEGWARYAEGLAEEAGLLGGDDARVLRRIWPARGMVLDPGVHVFGWSREQAVAYLVATGRFDTARAEDAVDRIAVLPGQLTAYDTGGLEIMALRHEAELALGGEFSLPEFNSVVLQGGAVPLATLRSNVREWLRMRKQSPEANLPGNTSAPLAQLR